MKLNIRRSSVKRLRHTGFRYRMKTKNGRRILNRRRRIGRRLSPKG